MPHYVELRARTGQRFAYGGRSLLIADLGGNVIVRTEAFRAEGTLLFSKDERSPVVRPEVLR